MTGMSVLNVQKIPSSVNFLRVKILAINTFNLAVSETKMIMKLHRILCPLEKHAQSLTQMVLGFLNSENVIYRH